MEHYVKLRSALKGSRSSSDLAHSFNQHLLQQQGSLYLPARAGFRGETER